MGSWDNLHPDIGGLLFVSLWSEWSGSTAETDVTDCCTFEPYRKRPVPGSQHAAAARLVCRSWSVHVAAAAKALCPNFSLSHHHGSAFPVPDWTSKFSSLQALQLQTHCNECPKITRANLDQLRSLSSLTSLHLCSGEVVTDSCLEALPHLKALTQLDLGNCTAITDRGLQPLASMPGLHVLSLENCYLITDEGAASSLRGLTAMHTLNLVGCYNVGDGVGKVVENMHGMQRLLISRCGVSEVGLEGLDHLKDLQALEMNFCHNVSLGSIGHLSRLTTLRSLSLRIMKVTDDSLRSVLQVMPHLRSLNLSQCFFLTDACAPTLSRLKRLEQLDLSWTEISNGGLSHLHDLPSLRLLYLENSSVTFQGLAALAAMMSLTGLWFKDCEVSPEEVAVLRRSFPAGVTLHN
mmetsp:Transcript_2360/g.6856  ORF Transcript_2360/g.6856 Transcript_2360/m.6856 type:complete len:407 (-) Transcript_2360:302-1522(-)